MSLTRRLFLGRIGATSAVASLSAVAVSPSASASTECPQLVALSKQMAEAEARYLAADDEYRSARARAEALMPSPPACIVVPRDQPRRGSNWRSEPLRLVDEMPAPWSEATVFVLQESFIYQVCEEFDALDDDDPLKGSRQHLAYQQVQRAHAQWMQAREQVRQDTGFDTAQTERSYAERDIGQLAVAIFALDAQTTAGLLIQARAITTAAALNENRHWVANTFGPKLAMATERVLGGEEGPP